MKYLIFLTVFAFFSLNINAQFVDEMRYWGKSEVLFNNQVLKKPKQFRLLIEEKNNTGLTKAFKKYKRKHRIHQIFGGFTNAVGPSTAFSEFDGTQQAINYWVIPVVAVTTGEKVLSKKPFHRAIKALVDEYNDVVLIENIRLGRESSQNIK
ncbi:MAG: hypothetical protein ACI9V1_000865 [Spirosomataceae bacterium]|jgi:hypothetical protein